MNNVEFMMGHVMRRLPREGEISVEGVFKALETLSYIEQKVLKDAFGLEGTQSPLSIEELCEQRNFTRSEAEHILVRAYRKLAEPSRIRLYHIPTQQKELARRKFDQEDI